MRIFDRQDFLRVNRARARIKVLIDKIGIDAFRELVEEELRGDWVAERDFSLERDPVRRRRAGGRARAAAHYAARRTATSASSTGSSRPTSRAQRQEGFVTVEVKIRRGDLTPEQIRGLAQIMRDYSGGYARTTVQQNLVLRWVRGGALRGLARAVASSSLGDAGADEITDVVSCPGTDSCKLGITSSMGLNGRFRTGWCRWRWTTS